MIRFAQKTLLPHYDEGELESMKMADAYDYLRHSYDGRINKIEIQPYVYSGEKSPYTKLIPSGKTYWIGEAHLTRLLIAGGRP